MALRKYPHTKLAVLLIALTKVERDALCDYHRGFWDGMMLGSKLGVPYLDCVGDSKEYENGYASGDRAYKREIQHRDNKK